MPPTITEAFPSLPLAEMVDLVNAFSGMTSWDKKVSIERLVDMHPILNLEWGPGWRYRRCRKLTDGDLPSHVDQLIWHQGVPATLGRANPGGYPVLYLADRPDTALAEARVTRGLAVIADFIIQPGKQIRVAPIGELAKIQRTGRGFLLGEESDAVSRYLNACSPEQAKSLLIADSFLLDCLVGHDDYNISSHVALALFNKRPEVSAVAYPSRRQYGAINFAVRVEGFWDAWALSSVRFGFAQHLAMGYFDMPINKAVDGIYNGGRLKWQDMSGEQEYFILEPAYVYDH